MQGFEQLMNFYHTIFIVCGIAAFLFLWLSITLFFVLKIPQIFGVLTGRVARKAIEQKNRAGALTTSKLLRRTGSLGKGLKAAKEGVKVNETTLLEPGKPGMGDFIILKSIVEVHTDKVVM